MTTQLTLRRGLLTGLTIAAATLALAGGSSANAPTGHFVVASGVVTDTLTGLKWQQAVGTTTYALSTATTYCDGLVLGGSSAWRLPSARELASLVDLTQSNPATDTTAFPSTPASWFWSQTGVLYNTGDGLEENAFAVNFADGTLNYMAVYSTNAVRCVQ